MTPSKSQDISRDEVELILPWYVAGTLSAEETAQVDAFLAHSREFDAQIATLREDLSATKAANEAVPGAALAARERLMADINANASLLDRARSMGKRLLEPIEAFLYGLAPGGLGFAATVAALIIGAQAVMLVGLMTAKTNTGAELAGVETVTHGTAFLIQFKPDADFGDIASLMRELNAKIVSGPAEGGLVKIRVGNGKLDQSAHDALLAKLKNRSDLIGLVLRSD